MKFTEHVPGKIGRFLADEEGFLTDWRRFTQIASKGNIFQSRKYLSGAAKKGTKVHKNVVFLCV